ncbi:MAG TPA: cupin domain-containing protein, partial [Chloroflexota bacterium]|nr:cupin domain-containing protein [Chloroflexota bacterium]
MKIQSAPSGISVARPGAADLKPWPGDARTNVSGDPETCGEFLWRSADGRGASGVWKVTPGVFDTTYPWDETFCILEGEVTLTDQDGESLNVRAGHQVFVPIGSTVCGDVKEKHRKVFHIRADEPLGEAG